MWPFNRRKKTPKFIATEKYVIPKDVKILNGGIIGAHGTVFVVVPEYNSADKKSNDEVIK